MIYHSIHIMTIIQCLRRNQKIQYLVFDDFSEFMEDGWYWCYLSNEHRADASSDGALAV